jgi:hypothetical protein
LRRLARKRRQFPDADVAPAPLTDGVWIGPNPAEPVASATNAIVNFFTGQNQPAPATQPWPRQSPQQAWPRAAQTQSTPYRPARREDQYDGLPPASIPNAGHEASQQPGRSFFGLF